MQKEKKKIRIVCIMGKSGTGKSTVINDLVRLYPEVFYAVKSFTTREPRENDPEDLKTHVFSDVIKFNVDKAMGTIISEYHSDKGYYSWTTHSCFKKDKINLYAIDPKACIEFIEKYSDIYDIYPIYIFINDEERLERLKKRDNIDILPEESHLSLDLLEPLFKTYMEPELVLGYHSKKENVQSFISKIINLIVKRNIK